MKQSARQLYYRSTTEKKTIKEIAKFLADLMIEAQENFWEVDCLDKLHIDRASTKGLSNIIKE